MLHGLHCARWAVCGTRGPSGGVCQPGPRHACAGSVAPPLLLPRPPAVDAAARRLRVTPFLAPAVGCRFVPGPGFQRISIDQPRLDCSDVGLGDDQELWLLQLPHDVSGARVACPGRRVF
jgi:hypothetical protein